MAVKARQAVAVSTVAVRIDSDPTDGLSGDSVMIVAQDSGTLVLGGDATLTAINGCRLPVVAGTVITLDLATGEQLWGITASSTVHLDVLLQGA